MRNEIAELIPHQGSMCLLERVIDWDEGRIVLATATHRNADNPLRSQGRLRAVHLCEYGAQAMAVHGGLAARAQGKRAKPALLVALRDVRLLVDYVEQLSGELSVTAIRLLGTAASSQYSFEVRHDSRLLANGRAAIMVQAA